MAKAPWHIWVVGVIAVLFNAIGVFDYTMFMAQGADYLAKAGMTSEQIAFQQQLPLWMRIDWAVGVWTALIASVLILARSKLAFPVFVLSLAAFLVSVLHSYVLSEGGRIAGTAGAITSVVITAELAFCAWYSRAMTRKGVFR